MDTPIVDFIKNYKKIGTSRLHMPGHKGVSFLGCEPFDITEIQGADELFSPQGIIKRSEENASKLFNTKRTLYSAGGSTQSIHAMIYLAYIKRNKCNNHPYILAGRNAHKSLIYAISKVDADIKWLYPTKNDSICSCDITAKDVELKLKDADEMPFAVYITSPDYLGKITDIASISKVCNKYNIPLLVDNAHGSYLKFCPEDLHPISLGADICCDSAHKTLTTLTGAGYLHIAKSDKFNFAEYSVRAMELFGSTSPSYLILQSLDLCNKYLDNGISSDIMICANKINEVRKVMAEKGIKDISDEPLKITADFSKINMPLPLGDYFRKFNIECEYSDNDYIVFMFTPQNNHIDFERLISAFKNINFEHKNQIAIPNIIKGVPKLSIRKSTMAEFEEISIENSCGRICASPSVSCPPAIPIVVSGETITEKHIDLLNYYGIEKILVVKE